MPKHRLIHILLLPILAPILLVGLILSFISEPKARNAPKRGPAPTLKAQNAKKDNLQMGLMQELTEEPVTNT